MLQVYPVMVRMIWGFNGHLSAFRAEGSELTVMNGERGWCAYHVTCYSSRRRYVPVHVLLATMLISTRLLKIHHYH